MGLFTSLFKETPSVVDFLPQSIQEAYVSVLYPVAMADGDQSDDEVNTLSRLLLQTGLFSDIDASGLFARAPRNLQKFGAKTMIEGGMRMINQKYKPQLFCFCADLVLADGIVTTEEEEILEYLATVSTISTDTAKKIIEVSMIRAGI